MFKIFQGNNSVWTKKSNWRENYRKFELRILFGCLENNRKIDYQDLCEREREREREREQYRERGRYRESESESEI